MERNTAPLTLRFLARITRSLPGRRIAGAVYFRIVRRIWRRCKQGSYVLSIWDGIRMLVDPADYIGGMLAFIPHLYERWEMAAIKEALPKGGVLVDLGSNIGTYALRAARWAGSRGRVIAVEPDGDNYRTLCYNVRLNCLESVVATHRCGVSDQREALLLYHSVTGNRGGHNFSGRGSLPTQTVCFPLYEILKRSNVERVDVLKMDIEGFESRVLERYFEDVPSGSPLMPQYVLVEINGGPASQEDKRRLRTLLAAQGYVLVRDGENSLYCSSACFVLHGHGAQQRFAHRQ